MLNILVSILPPILLLFLINTFSSKNYKCQLNVIKCLLCGMFIVLPIAMLETLAMPNGLPNSISGILFSHFLIVGPIEELGKLFIVYFVVKKASLLEEKYPTNMIVYTFAGSMGFALIENIMYVTESGFSTGLLRAFTSVQMHGTTAIIIGYFGYKEVIMKEKNSWFKGLLIAIIMHGLYNSYASIFNNSKMFYGIFIIVFIYLVFGFLLLKNSKKLTIDNIKKEILNEFE